MDPRSLEPDASTAYRANLVRELAPEIRDAHVLDAIARVPRHRFLPGVSLARAYANRPIPIGFQQTISQPAVVGAMTQALDLSGRERVLEIGTGSGYQAAILSLLAAEVFSIERVPELADVARSRLRRLGYTNVEVRTGDGYAGWPERAPFDRILVTAAPDAVPDVLFAQLGPAGILVAPVGGAGGTQRLFRYSMARGLVPDDLGGVSFVPMIPGTSRGGLSH